MPKKLGSFLVLSLLVLAVSGCATLASTRAARGTGTGRIYQAPFGTVWEKIPPTMGALGINLVEANEKEGYFLAQVGMSGFSWGENVAVFVQPLEGDRTRVEVVSKRKLATNIIAWNWETRVLNQLDQSLHASSQFESTDRGDD